MKRIISFILIFAIFAISGTVFAAQDKLVAITFDDGPSQYTGRLLDALKDRGAKATFFVVGEMAAAHPDLLKRIAEEGHQLANHTADHKNLANCSEGTILSQLEEVNAHLRKAAGEQNFWLRPPYGSYNKKVKQTVSCPIILWSVDTLDWKYRNADTVYQNIISSTGDGDIILLHDLYSTSVEGAIRAIDTLQSRGFKFVTVKELLRRRAITPENGKAYTSAYPKGITLPEVSSPTAAVIFNGLYSKVVMYSAQGAIIRYTVDGGEPTAESALYEKPFRLTKNAQISLAAYNDEGTASEAVYLTEEEMHPTLSVRTADQMLYPHRKLIYPLGVSHK